MLNTVLSQRLRWNEEEDGKVFHWDDRQSVFAWVWPIFPKCGS